MEVVGLAGLHSRDCKHLAATAVGHCRGVVVLVAAAAAAAVVVVEVVEASHDLGRS